MTEDEKHNLLRKDLCARFPYYVKLKVKYQDDPCKLFVMHQWETIYVLLVKGYPIEVKLTDCQPYLRPMSSMTEEEFGFLQEHLPYDFTRIYSGKFNLIDDIHLGDSISIDDMAFLLDYLNKRHFDYRGLIEKGLAIEAPEGMYNFNK